MCNFCFSFYSETDIFYHLTGIQFNGKDALDLFGQCFNGFRGEGPQRDGAEQSNPQTFGPGQFYRFLSNAG